MAAVVRFETNVVRHTSTGHRAEPFISKAPNANRMADSNGNQNSGPSR
jgi:hypothetical protein